MSIHVFPTAPIASKVYQSLVQSLEITNLLKRRRYEGVAGRSTLFLESERYCLHNPNLYINSTFCHVRSHFCHLIWDDQFPFKIEFRNIEWKCPKGRFAILGRLLLSCSSSFHFSSSPPPLLHFPLLLSDSRRL